MWMIISFLGMTTFKYTHTHEKASVESHCYADQETSHSHSETPHLHDNCAVCLLFHFQHAPDISSSFIELADVSGIDLLQIDFSYHFYLQDYLARIANKDPPLFS